VLANAGGNRADPSGCPLHVRVERGGASWANRVSARGYGVGGTFGSSRQRNGDYYFKITSPVSVPGSQVNIRTALIPLRWGLPWGS